MILRGASAIGIATAAYIPPPPAPSPPPTPFDPPYDLPTAGNAVAIGTNSAEDIRPAGITTAGNWNYALFNCYGGGTLVEDFSDGGAWVIAGSGGHSAPRNIGAAVFDFEDATWKRIEPTNAVATYSDSDYGVSATTGSPYYEVTGSGGLPSPPHPYQNLCPLPTSLGGGTQGSVIYVTRSAIANESVSSLGVHRFDLASGTWSRLTDNLATRGGSDGSAVYDAARGRYWLLPDDQNDYNTQQYLRASDWTWQTTAAGSYIADNAAAGRLFMHEGLLIRQGNSNTLVAYDPADEAQGWVTLTTSGTFPARVNVFAPYNGKFYWMPNTGGSTLTRLTPPVNPLSGTWVCDTVSIGGATIPARNANPVRLDHYTGLFYVPSIECLAWIAGGSEDVILIRPE